MRTNIHKTLFKVADFISWQKQGRLQLSPYFQRRSVWKKGTKSFLIDTIVRGLPIPIIFIRDRRINPDDFEACREVIDGQQRLRTLMSYICPNYLDDFNQERDEFTVTRAHNKEIAEKKFSDLNKDTKEAILEYEFNVHILPTRMDDREVVQIFRRMNSTSYSLKKQELRNAEYFGEFKTAVYELAEEQLHRWRKWKTFTPDDIARMVEAEFVSECIILMLERGILGKSPSKIDSAYKKYDSQFKVRNEVEKRFRAVMDAVDEIITQSNMPFVLTRKKVFYTFFAYVYDFLFDLDTTASRRVKAKGITQRYINKILRINEVLYERNAPKDVLESTDRRTTNPKERKRLFKYLNEEK